jgi:ribosomal-protein-alanine N-acetyltransferase
MVSQRGKLAGMEVVLSELTAADADEFMAAVLASQSLHAPWVAPPGTPDRFARYLARSQRDDQAC